MRGVKPGVASQVDSGGVKPGVASQVDSGGVKPGVTRSVDRSATSVPQYWAVRWDPSQVQQARCF